jgi:acyl-CoA synthetase (AMP-forming)/AMP-acid ligase II/acyl carrier protein
MNNLANLVDLLQWRLQEEPEKRAYTLMIDGKEEGSTLTYAQLDRQARAIAALLQSYQSEGERVLLLFPQSLEVIAAFMGCLYAGVIAIPAPAPEASRLKRTLPRLQAIASDAGASIVLTTAGIISLLGESVIEFPAMRWLASEEIDLELASDWQQLHIPSDRLAYLQYTSGSTSTPKGVAIAHDNLLHHCTYLQKYCAYTPNSVSVTWMPYFHDYGLVEGLIQPLYNGTPCYVMSPFALIRRPFNWLNNISRYRATHSQAPNFAYDLCVRRISAEQRAQLDLSNWRAAGNAAEPIDPKVLESFARIFAACGFRPEAFCPAYGLAEATLLVSSNAITKIPSIIALDPATLERGQVVETKEEQKIVRRIAGCGRLIGNTKVAIVNPHTLTKCMPDRIGEIWVADPSVARGYWQRKEESERTFRAYLADTGEGPFLRTGDLGFIKDGELFVTGRIKDVIIIRGSNYYPQDIEWSVQQTHPCLRSQNGAAFAVEIDGQEKLVIVQELERGYLQDLDLNEVFELIIREVFEQYEIQVHAICLIKSGTLLKTSSGKIQRSASRQAFLEGSLETLASWSATTSEIIPSFQANGNSLNRSKDKIGVKSIQKWLIALLDREWKIPSKTIDLQKPFAYYGIDSVMAVNLSQELEDWLERPIEATIVWNFPTIESLASHLANEINSQDYSAKQKPDLNKISTEEIAQLLSQEIATVRQHFK